MNSKSSIFDSILNTIESEDIRKFAERCIETIPDYFWNVGAVRQVRESIILNMLLVI